VLALPRGGVPVGFEVATALGLPLDVFVVRKLGVPGNPEYAMGAIASGGLRVLDHDLVRRLGVSDEDVAEVVERETAELARRDADYRRGRRALAPEGRAIVLVDDGLATGSTMLAAVRALRQRAPQRLTVAAPTGSADACQRLARETDAVVCPHQPLLFRSVGEHYGDFRQTSDAQVLALLAAPLRPAGAAPTAR